MGRLNQWHGSGMEAAVPTPVPPPEKKHDLDYEDVEHLFRLTCAYAENGEPPVNAVGWAISAFKLLETEIPKRFPVEEEEDNGDA